MVTFVSPKERMAAGRSARDRMPRSAHKQLGRIERDPIPLLKLAGKGRVSSLLPLHYGRMSASPLAFLRGSAIVQAHDLAGTPHSGLTLQICGDCHLSNFGGFSVPGSAEELFDVNDFDETAVGPWEWDLKRLAASFTVAARQFGFARNAADIVRELVAAYCQRMTAYAGLGTLELWYTHTPLSHLLEEAGSLGLRDLFDRNLEHAVEHAHYVSLSRMAERSGKGWKLRDAPPTLFHLYGPASLLPADDPWAGAGNWRALMAPVYREYLQSLVPDRARLLDNFTMQDLAFKVVGVGSVGTRCLILLLTDQLGKPLFLQFKEAATSVVARYFKTRGAGSRRHAGQCVVEGQRLMQVISDPFLGWATGPGQRPLYGRQLRDMKIGAQVELFKAPMFAAYARLCGWTLARAHARNSGRALELSGYLGTGGPLGDALARYASGYADQVERDYDAFRVACREGRLIARTDADMAAEFVA
jgi:uncharacterized protein (DUF2252 family)